MRPPDPAGRMRLPDGPATPDPGRQPERTRLAWRRSVLSLSVVAVLTARYAIERGGATAPLAVAGVLAAWLAVLVLSWRRITALAAAPGPAGWAVPLTALAAVGFAGLGVALVLSR